MKGSGALPSPAPKSEGPGAPSFWAEEVTGNGVTRHRNFVGQFGLGEGFFGVWETEIGEDISAADDVIRFLPGHGSGLSFSIDFDGSPGSMDQRARWTSV